MDQKEIEKQKINKNLEMMSECLAQHEDKAFLGEFFFGIFFSFDQFLGVLVFSFDGSIYSRKKNEQCFRKNRQRKQLDVDFFGKRGNFFSFIRIFKNKFFYLKLESFQSRTAQSQFQFLQLNKKLKESEETVFVQQEKVRFVF